MMSPLLFDAFPLDVPPLMRLKVTQVAPLELGDCLLVTAFYKQVAPLELIHRGRNTWAVRSISLLTCDQVPFHDARSQWWNGIRRPSGEQFH